MDVDSRMEAARGCQRLGRVGECAELGKGDQWVLSDR